MTAESPDDLRLQTAVRGLLSQIGAEGDVALQRLSPGRNNRVYRVEAGAGRFLLKAYFSHPDDPRDRLQAEFGFCRFVWDRGIRAVPESLAADDEERLALYEWIDGRALSAGDLAREHVTAAIDFFVELNRHRRHPGAGTLPAASEACFDLRNHLRQVSSRLRSLEEMPSATPLHGAARQFVKSELQPSWRRITAAVADQSARVGTAPDEVLDEAARCLSPSDFGFHNALLEPSGRVRFIDFEYAGWDDPAKTVCDFFCQPQVPVPAEFLRDFVQGVADAVPECNDLPRRVALLLPVYRVKWCAIMMNEFLPAGASRRGFAGGPHDEERLRRQLDAARATFERVIETT